MRIRFYRGLAILLAGITAFSGLGLAVSAKKMIHPSDYLQINAESVLDDEAAVEAVSLDLDGMIGLNFYMSLPADADYVDLSSTAQGTKRHYVSEADSTSDGWTVFTYDLAAKEMQDDVSVTVFDEQGSIITLANGNNFSYSVMDYLDHVLDPDNSYESSNSKLYELAYAMKEYGQRAQVYFNYNQAGIQANELPQFTSLSSFRKTTNGTLPAGLVYEGDTLVLKSGTELRFYFTSDNINNYSFSIDGESVGAAVKDAAQKLYYVSVSDISSIKLGEKVTLVVTDDECGDRFEVSGGPFTYAYEVQEKCAETDPLYLLCNALYQYYRRAAIYFDKGDPENDDAAEYYEYSQLNDLVVRFFDDYENSTASDISSLRSIKVDYRRDEPKACVIELESESGTAILRDGYTGKKWEEAYSDHTLNVYNLTPGYDSTVTADGKTYIVHPTGALRMIYAPTAYNIRDLGGWACDGGTVKYGKIFRGGELNGTHGFAINEEDAARLRNIGISNDVDLRNDSEAESITVSPLGSTVTYNRISTQAGGGGLDLSGNPWNASKTTDALRNIMTAAVNGKGSYFHCYEGADRTGVMGFLVLSILGVDEIDARADYELTTFSETPTAYARTRQDSRYTDMIAAFDKMEGLSMRDKCVNWALTAGISIDEINAFRRAMTDGTPEVLTDTRTSLLTAVSVLEDPEEDVLEAAPEESEAEESVESVPIEEIREDPGIDNSENPDISENPEEISISETEELTTEIVRVSL